MDAAGQMIAKDAVREFPDTRFYFLAAAVALFCAAIYVFGYPMLIVSALIATGSALSLLVVLTAYDLVLQRRTGHATGNSAGR